MYKKTESVFPLDNGDKIHVVAEYAEYVGKFLISRVGVKPKGMRNVRWVDVTDDYNYRVLDTEKRDAYEFAKWREVATLDMLNQALTNAWKDIKPDPLAEECGGGRT